MTDMTPGNRLTLSLGDVQETLLLPLWGRAVESQKEYPLLADPLAIETINRLDYDFSTISHKISTISQIAWVARALLFDAIINRFLKDHPYGTVVNIGCGFDTTFERIDNGTVRWYDLDLPDVMAARQLLFKNHPRRTALACSFLDQDWLDSVAVKHGILFVSAGVFYYFLESEIKEFLIRIADRFPGSEIAFDATSSTAFANKAVIKRGNFKALLTWELKDPALLEAWNSRISLQEVIPMFRPVRHKLGPVVRILAALSDRLKMQYVLRVTFA